MTTTNSTHYPDTPAGVRRYLRAHYERPDDVKGARLTPDPHVHGCWLATLRTGVKLLVYVGAHPYAPDFEEVES